MTRIFDMLFDLLENANDTDLQALHQALCDWKATIIDHSVEDK